MGRASRMHCKGGWVEPKIHLGVVMKRKIYALPEIHPGHHPVASHYTIIKHLVIKNDISDMIMNLTISVTVLLIHF
jgi:hypothetical protein